MAADGMAADSEGKLEQDVKPHTPPIRRSVLLGIAAYAAFLSLGLFMLATSTDALLGVGRFLGVFPGEDPVVQGRIRDVLDQGETIPDGAVLMLGDSIIEWLDAAAIGPDVHNLGISSLTTGKLASFLPRLRPLPGARAVVLGIGGNDLGHEPRADVLRLYAGAVAAMPVDMPLIVIAVLPMNETEPSVRQWPVLRNANIDRMNKDIRTICARRPRCHLLLTQPFLADAAGNLRDDLHAGDGRHLSAEGSRRLVDAIRDVLARALNPLPPIAE